MSLRVLSVAYPLAPVGPRAVGGAEQILTQLEAALVRGGYSSVVVARADSVVSGRLVGTEASAEVVTPELRAEVERRHQATLDRALGVWPVDLVHMHGLDFSRYRVPAEVPVLVTLHMPPGWYPEEIWNLPPRYELVCVSETQRRQCPVAVRERIRVIGNGVASAPCAVKRKGRFVLMLSRICPEKNLHMGLDAARLAGVPAVLAGEVFPYPEHLRYFEEEIRPRLGRGARFIGPVGGAAKQRLLARARCLLVPSLAPETSSLVAMEAFAAGTPVCAVGSGALPEIVEEGRTGFLVENDADAMAKALRRVNTLDAEHCRAEAERRFSLARMVEEYCTAYCELVARTARVTNCVEPSEQ